MNSNTRNTVIGIAAIFAILIGYTFLTKPSKEELEKQRKYNDSIVNVQKARRISDSIAATLAAKDSVKKDSLNKVQTKPTDTASEIAGPVKDKGLKYGQFSASASGTQKHIILESDLLKIKVATLGGGISSVELRKFKTFDGQPLVLFNTDSSNYSITFFSDNRDINSSGLYFEPVWLNSKFSDKDSVAVSGTDSVVLTMRLYPNLNDSMPDKSRYLEFVYSLRGDNYMMNFGIATRNMQKAIAENNTYLAFDWKVDLTQQEQYKKNELINTSVYFKPAQDKVDYLSETKDDSKEKLPNLKWISFKQQFFGATLIAGDKFTRANIETREITDTTRPRALKNLSASITLDFNAATDNQYPMSFYFGPLKYNVLTRYDLDLERQIPLGWSFFLLQWINRFAVIPVFDLLSNTGMNYGIIILILTILLKLILLPIAYKTYMSSAKMRVLKPEVEEIGKKFPKKEDALKKQQATMALYKKAGVNPMSGCIPLLLQMPILIAMYRFFPASIELRQQSFLWAHDLSTYDSIYSWSAQIPLLSTFYGNHISLFTLLMTITTIIYTRINNQMMGATTQPGMKFVMYAMPVMFLGFFNNFAAGLSYYYFLANIITFLQMFLFQKFINHDKIHARIQENKKKPVKVSGFQKRLEAMAKKRGYNPPKK